MTGIDVDELDPPGLRQFRHLALLDPGPGLVGRELRADDNHRYFEPPLVREAHDATDDVLRHCDDPGLEARAGLLVQIVRVGPLEWRPAGEDRPALRRLGETGIQLAIGPREATDQDHCSDSVGASVRGHPSQRRCGRMTHDDNAIGTRVGSADLLHHSGQLIRQPSSDAVTLAGQREWTRAMTACGQLRNDEVPGIRSKPQPGNQEDIHSATIRPPRERIVTIGMMATMTGARKGILAALAVEVLYGVSFVFTKNATDVAPPISLLAWRFGVALAILMALAAARVIRLSIRRRDLVPLAFLALYQPVIYYVGETFGVGRTTASESGIILAAIPVTTVLCSWAVLRKHPTRRQVAGILLTFVGIVVTVVAGGVTAGLDVVGYVCLFVAVVAYSLFSVQSERTTEVRDIDKTFVMIAWGAVAFGTIAVADHSRHGTLMELWRLPWDHPPVLIGVGYLAVGASIGAFFLQNVAIARLGSNRFSTFIGVSTIAALVAAALVRGERLNAGQLAGAAVILGGVYVANSRADRNAIPRQRP